MLCSLVFLLPVRVLVNSHKPFGVFLLTLPDTIQFHFGGVNRSSKAFTSVVCQLYFSAFFSDDTCIVWTLHFLALPRFPLLYLENSWCLKCVLVLSCFSANFLFLSVNSGSCSFTFPVFSCVWSLQCRYFMCRLILTLIGAVSLQIRLTRLNYTRIGKVLCMAL